MIGRLDITPRQTIILDRTQCDIPEFPTVPVPTILPPPQPVASNAPAVCVSLSETAQKAYAKASILRCELRAECDSGLACVLNIGESKYRVDINLTRSSVAFGVLSSDGQTRYGGSKNKNTTVTLPAPQGTALLFGQLLETDKVGFKVRVCIDGAGYFLSITGFLVSTVFKFCVRCRCRLFTKFENYIHVHVYIIIRVALS